MSIEATGEVITSSTRFLESIFSLRSSESRVCLVIAPSILPFEITGIALNRPAKNALQASMTVESWESEGVRSAMVSHFSLSGFESLCLIERSSISPKYLPFFTMNTGSPLFDISFTALETGSEASRMLGCSISMLHPQIHRLDESRQQIYMVGFQIRLGR